MNRIFKYLFLIITIVSISACKSTKDVDKLIDQREWDKAYEVASKWYLDLPYSYVMLPHMTDLVLNGDYTIAKQICSEKRYMRIYYQAIMNNLERIYDNQGEDKLLYAMASIGRPNIDRLPYYMDISVGGIWSYGPLRDGDDFIKYNNYQLESFMGVLDLKGEKALIRKLAVYLMPSPVYGDKTGKMDNSEVKRIKQKFGVK